MELKNPRKEFMLSSPSSVLLKQSAAISTSSAEAPEDRLSREGLVVANGLALSPLEIQILAIIESNSVDGHVSANEWAAMAAELAALVATGNGQTPGAAGGSLRYAN